MSRSFRSPESYAAEHSTRNMLASFLRERGFSDVTDVRTQHGPAQSQTLGAVDENGERVLMWVRLCWRKSKDSQTSGYSAAQLRSKVDDGDWVGTLRAMAARESSRGVTHLLLIQRAGDSIRFGASIPICSVVPIWIAQRDTSRRLIEIGLMGKRTKNHAMNGSSPTLWLEDERAPTVADALWNHAGVRDLAMLPLAIPKGGAPLGDDSIDDLPGVDYASLGSDGSPLALRMTSGVKRDPRVRRAVFERSRGVCERSSCRASRSFVGFFDVHHILGAEKSDRVWNCITLCPNCHREAHTSPDREAINAEMLQFTRKFEPGFE